MRVVSPSMLAANFGELRRDTEMLDRSAAEWIHIDVMDGVFVPNISFGFPVMEAIRSYSDKVMDVHLMIVDPERYVERFVKAGADIVVFHVESTERVEECIALIRKAGAKVGVALKPATDVEVVRDILPLVDMVLVMSVEPGFGGQAFIPCSVDRIKALRAMSDEMGLDVMIEVDGGIGADNAAMIYDAGANVLVAGNSLFKAEDVEAEILKVLNAK